MIKIATLTLLIHSVLSSSKYQMAIKEKELYLLVLYITASGENPEGFFF